MERPSFSAQNLDKLGANKSCNQITVVKRPSLSIGNVESAVYDPLPEIHYTDYTQFADELIHRPSSFTQCRPGCRCRCNESRTETQQVLLSVRLSSSRVPPDEIFCPSALRWKGAQSAIVLRIDVSETCFLFCRETVTETQLQSS